MRTKKILFLLLVLVFLSFTTGCLGLFNSKPIIESTPGTTAKVGMEYTYEIDATDPDADDVLTYSLSEWPTDMVINASTGAVSWTPTGTQIGYHQVIIEVNDGNVSVSQKFTITVAEAELSSIEVVPSEMRIPIGDSETIASITAHYENETTAEVELNSTDVSYISDDEEIATVSELGVITGVTEGTAVITVTYTEGEITKTATITVTVPSNLNQIKVLPEFMIILEGNSESITSIKAYHEGSTTPVDIALNEAIYTVDSTDTSDIITVNASGMVTGELASEDWQTVIVSYTEGSITQTDTVYVKIELPPIILTSPLTVLPETMEIAAGDTKNITDIIASYNNETTKNIALNSADVDYISSNTGVATVDTTGVVTAVAVGTAAITVSYTETGITEIDTVAVTVTE